MDSQAAVGCVNVLINSRLLSLTKVHIKIFYQVNFLSENFKDGFYSL